MQHEHAIVSATMSLHLKNGSSKATPSLRSLDMAHLPASCTKAMCHTLQDINKAFIWLLKVALYRHVLLTVQFTFYPPLIHLMSELIGINGGQIAVKFARAEPCKLLIWSGISPWPPQAKRPAKILRHEMIRESVHVLLCEKQKEMFQNLDQFHCWNNTWKSMILWITGTFKGYEYY